MDFLWVWQWLQWCNFGSKFRFCISFTLLWIDIYLVFQHCVCRCLLHYFQVKEFIVNLFRMQINRICKRLFPKFWCFLTLASLHVLSNDYFTLVFLYFRQIFYFQIQNIYYAFYLDWYIFYLSVFIELTLVK